MNYKTARMYLLAEELRDQLKNDTLNSKFLSLNKLQNFFPAIENEDLEKILALLEIQHEMNTSQEVQMEIVVTAPIAISNQRRTIGVLKESIENAKRIILITGYAVSEFASEIIKLLVMKSDEGVHVKFFIDKNVNSHQFTAALSNPHFELYKYKNSNASSSMHAKIIVIDDEKAFISSSNLSYNGLVNNFEVGVMVTGQPVEEFKEIFSELTIKKYFYKIN